MKGDAIRKRILFASVCWIATGAFTAIMGAWLELAVPINQCPVNVAGGTYLVACNVMGMLMVIGGILALLGGIAIYLSRHTIERLNRRFVRRR